MQTSATGYDLLNEIADYFEVLASDSEAWAKRGLGKKTENKIRAAVWREAAADIRSIKLVCGE